MNFIALSSVPRSGSTVLMYLLNQNPTITIGGDSFLSYLLNDCRLNVKKNILEYQIPHQQVTECLLNFCRSGANSWVDSLRNDKIFVDKSRGWLVDMDFTFKVFPELKLIINVRDLRSIINSFEKINHNSIYADKKFFYKNIDSDLQLQRIDGILNFQVVKEVLTSLRELVEVPKQYTSNILITRYEDLIETPESFMKTLYEFLEMPYFEHNFDNIEQTNNYNDNPFVPYGDHRISNKLLKTVDDNWDYVRPDLLERLKVGYSWYFKNLYSDRMDNK